MDTIETWQNELKMLETQYVRARAIYDVSEWARKARLRDAKVALVGGILGTLLGDGVLPEVIRELVRVGRESYEYDRWSWYFSCPGVSTSKKSVVYEVTIGVTDTGCFSIKAYNTVSDHYDSLPQLSKKLELPPESIKEIRTWFLGEGQQC